MRRHLYTILILFLTLVVKAQTTTEYLNIIDSKLNPSENVAVEVYPDQLAIGSPLGMYYTNGAGQITNDLYGGTLVYQKMKDIHVGEDSSIIQLIVTESATNMDLILRKYDKLGVELFDIMVDRYFTQIGADYSYEFGDMGIYFSGHTVLSPDTASVAYISYDGVIQERIQSKAIGYKDMVEFDDGSVGVMQADSTGGYVLYSNQNGLFKTADVLLRLPDVYNDPITNDSRFITAMYGADGNHAIIELASGSAERTLVLVDKMLNPIASYQFPEDSMGRAYRIKGLVYANGQYHMLYHAFDTPPVYDQAHYIVFDNTLRVLQMEVYSSATRDIVPSAITANSSGTVVLTGDFDGFNTIINRGAIIPEEKVTRGHLYFDSNEDCVKDTNEIGLANWIITVQNSPSVFGYTNGSGDFALDLPTGTHTINAVSPPNTLWQLPCNSITVTVDTSVTDTNIYKIGVGVDEPCPMLSVQLGGTTLRPCFARRHGLTYCNTGAYAVDSAHIILTLEDSLRLTAPSVPVDSIGNNKYRFDVGTVPVNWCKLVSYSIVVDCNAQVGRTYCMKANIYPDSLCLPVDPNWEGASLELDASCETDSVAFRIVNNGQNMTDPAEYAIIQDDVMYANGSTKINAGQTKFFRTPANGKTWTMSLNQVPGHPGTSRPLKSVEGCRSATSTQPISLGFVAQFPQDDGNSFVDILCITSTTAIDPNDKTPEPLGVGADGLIDNNQQMEYLIRFQNTGTDTAYTVILRDTLTDLLEMTSLKLGAASHNHTFSIENGRVLTWTFNNIDLPDSNVNEPLSHGFVQFSVNQVPDLQPGTVIQNRAGIYFDFEAPVITNWAKNTIVDSLLAELQVSIFEQYTADGINRIYPNPNNGRVTIDLKDTNGQTAQLKVYTVAGQVVSQSSWPAALQKRTTQLDLQPGLYFYDLLLDDNTLSRGKLLVE